MAIAGAGVACVRVFIRGAVFFAVNLQLAFALGLFLVKTGWPRRAIWILVVARAGTARAHLVDRGARISREKAVRARGALVLSDEVLTNVIHRFPQGLLRKYS